MTGGDGFPWLNLQRSNYLTWGRLDVETAKHTCSDLTNSFWREGGKCTDERRARISRIGKTVGERSQKGPSPRFQPPPSNERWKNPSDCGGWSGAVSQSKRWEKALLDKKTALTTEKGKKSVGRMSSEWLLICAKWADSMHRDEDNCQDERYKNCLNMP